MPYAEKTDVTSDRSRTQIERVLEDHGATAFGYATSAQVAMIQFDLAGLRIQFRITLPDRKDPAFTLSPGRRTQRSPEAARASYEQAVRQRWRALYLVVRAKLEAVEAGISSVQEEFLAHIELPDGSRFGDYALPAVAKAYAGSPLPELTAGGPR